MQQLLASMAKQMQQGQGHSHFRVEVLDADDLEEVLGKTEDDDEEEEEAGGRRARLQRIRAAAKNQAHAVTSQILQQLAAAKATPSSSSSSSSNSKHAATHSQTDAKTTSKSNTKIKNKKKKKRNKKKKQPSSSSPSPSPSPTSRPRTSSPPHTGQTVEQEIARQLQEAIAQQLGLKSAPVNFHTTDVDDEDD
eukprot:TRINITY_DN2042_c0_g2_i4.p1 TRINITY_DN2042_c0_g2~~TRINITY_DN2042_c0_g2_i4.p1  ORF type:complete len:193 (+),score=64.71 TRINITY_DN2042_c0_g2_i4:39-617(+)